jgi:hypothetical protein
MVMFTDHLCSCRISRRRSSRRSRYWAIFSQVWAASSRVFLCSRLVVCAAIFRYSSATRLYCETLCMAQEQCRDGDGSQPDRVPIIAPIAPSLRIPAL